MNNTDIKRHFYNGVHYEIDEISQTVKLKDEFYEKLKTKRLGGKFGFKKIGGSSVGDVLEVDNFKSTFVAGCRASGIGLPILDKKYVNAGVAFEPKVINAIEEASKQKVITYDPRQHNFDYFTGIDKYLGGLPDGFLESKKWLLEIKTTGKKNIENGTKYGVPAAYIKQSQIYVHLMNIKHDYNIKNFAIIAAFLEEGDYENPQNIDIRQRQIKTWKYEFDQKACLDDVDYIHKGYEKYVLGGQSPQFDQKKDSELLEGLKCKNKKEGETLERKGMDMGKIIVY